MYVNVLHLILYVYAITSFKKKAFKVKSINGWIQRYN